MNSTARGPPIWLPSRRKHYSQVEPLASDDNASGEEVFIPQEKWGYCSLINIDPVVWFLQPDAAKAKIPRYVLLDDGLTWIVTKMFDPESRAKYWAADFDTDGDIKVSRESWGHPPLAFSTDDRVFYLVYKNYAPLTGGQAWETDQGDDPNKLMTAAEGKAKKGIPQWSWGSMAVTEYMDPQKAIQYFNPQLILDECSSLQVYHITNLPDRAADQAWFDTPTRPNPSMQENSDLETPIGGLDNQGIWRSAPGNVASSGGPRGHFWLTERWGRVSQ